MYHLKKENSKIFSSEGPRENVWGPRENVFPGPAVALDEPDSEGPLFRKSIVQIRATVAVLTFGLRLGLGLRLVGIVYMYFFGIADPNRLNNCLECQSSFNTHL